MKMKSVSLPDLPEIWQSTLQWQPTVEQQQRFQQLYEFILQGNQKQNLTRITDPQDFWEKHLWDSIRGIQRLLPESGARTLIDIGTGAGFPGVPIALIRPDWAVTLLDSTRKKTIFLNTILQPLQLANAQTLTERVEEVGHQVQQRSHYDLATLRAVSAVSVCAEYALPLLKVGGMAILYRGQWSDAERDELERAVGILGGQIDAVESFTTPLTEGIRHCVYLKKVRATPEAYPRAVGIPTQSPL